MQKGRAQWIKCSNPRGGKDARYVSSTKYPVGISPLLKHTCLSYGHKELYLVRHLGLERRTAWKEVLTWPSASAVLDVPQKKNPSLPIPMMIGDTPGECRFVCVCVYRRRERPNMSGHTVQAPAQGPLRSDILLDTIPQLASYTAEAYKLKVLLKIKIHEETTSYSLPLCSLNLLPCRHWDKP